MATRRWAGGRNVTSVPPIWMLPSDTCSSPAIIRSNVDLPQPDGPSSAQNEPSATVQVQTADDFDRAETLADAL